MHKTPGGGATGALEYYAAATIIAHLRNHSSISTRKGRIGRREGETNEGNGVGVRRRDVRGNGYD